MSITNNVPFTRWSLPILLIGMLMGANAVEAVDSFASSGPGETGQIVSAAQHPPQARSRQPGRTQGVYKDRITPHWFAENTCFWYRNNLSGDTKEFILVNAEQGTRRPAFDHQRLAAAISEASDASYQGDKLPFDSITLSDDAKSVRFTVDRTTWLCILDSYTCSQTDARGSAPSTDEAEPGPRFGRRRGPNREREQSADSPDGAWTALVKDNNVFIHSQSDDQDVQLSTDGEEGAAYGELSWASDSKTLVAFRIEPGDNKEVYRIESSPEGGGRVKLHSGPYALPGDKFATYELYLFDISTRKRIKPDVDRLEMEWGRPRLRWKKDQRRFMYEKIDRGHQRFRVIEVDSHTGQTRNLIDEKTETFIWTAHTENLGLDRVNWLGKTEEIVYASEQDGWRHLYLVDAEEGKTTNQITQGAWVVRGIDLIDEDARQIWFTACGKNPDQDPYLIHYYRVNFDGSGLTALTEGNGSHAIQYSPDRRYLIDTYSRVDTAPVHELRRVSDGTLVCALDEADITELKADGWTAPEVFVAKGRDGETDIWGIICRPRDLDPDKKYPVIEQIYAGPQSAYVPKRFSPRRSFTSLTDLGFIVVQIDGMGTAHRSKAFHDVCWKDLKDAGLPDRILWHQAAAKKYPYYDISRVGTYGVSAGGQSAAGAVLFHPEFYKAAVAASGCHDNRMDKASWNEQWMGYPVGPQYAESSNIENAYRLRGKLMLIAGEMDTNVPPESTLRFVDALIKAGKDFDLVFVPGAGHGGGGSYGDRRREDFFVRHLLGIDPPDRNAAERGETNP